MIKLLTGARISLRAKLLTLNVIVAGSLMLLSLQAWRAVSLQERAQARQVELAEALHLNKQADMLHDALRSNVMASLLVGQVAALDPDDVQQEAAANARGLHEALAGLSRVSLPPELAARVDHTERIAAAYSEAALGLVHGAGRDRGAALAELPVFEGQFQELLTALHDQGEALGGVLQAAHADAGSEASGARLGLLWACGLTVLLASAAVFTITQAVRRRLRSLAGVARAIADGDLARRASAAGSDELSDMGHAIDRMAESLSRMICAMRSDAQRATFGQQLTEALDMADRELQVATVAARAMASISPQHAMELLVSDSSRAQMERAAEHPGAGAPGCGVGSPYDCVAVRRGTVVSFETGEALNACAQLRGRPCGPVSATCVPVTFMGRAIGVLHAAGPVGASLAPEQVQQLGLLGTQLGMRIGTVRAFEKTQIQAATDSLTGLPNRRTIEQRLRTLSGGNGPFAVVMCDLDRFKLLNDTHGHGAGDTALRVFADVLRHALRDGDVMGRWGGEEFAFVLPGADAAKAEDTVNRLRVRLAGTLAMGKGPVFTASFGIADSTMSRRGDRLVQLADIALYRAKAAGRDRACIADPATDGDLPVVRHTDGAGSGIDHDAALNEEA